MNNKLVLIFIILCVGGLLSTVSFSAEAPQEQQSYWQSLKDWVSRKVTEAGTAIAPSAKKAAVLTAVAKPFGPRLSETPSLSSNFMVTSVGGGFAMEGIKNTWDAIINGSITSGLAGAVLLLVGLNMESESVAKSLQKVGVLNASVENLQTVFFALGASAIVAGLVSKVYHNVIAPLKSGAIPRTPKVNEVLRVMMRDMIRAVINDNEAYPTYSTKIHALLKRKEFLSGDDTDINVEQACNDLIAEIKESTHATPEEKEAEREIDEAITKLRRALESQYTTPQGQIGYLRKRALNRLSPQIRAVLSVLRRLQNELAIDIKRQAEISKNSVEIEGGGQTRRQESGRSWRNKEQSFEPKSQESESI